MKNALQKLMVLLLIKRIEYSDNYSITSGRLWNFKRVEIVNNVDVTNDNNAPLNTKKVLLVI